jgi:hypothetical protein
MEERIKREAMVTTFLQEREAVLNSKAKPIKVPPPLPDSASDLFPLEVRASLQSHGVTVRSPPYRSLSPRSPKLMGKASRSPRQCRRHSPRRGTVVNERTVSPKRHHSRVAGLDEEFSLNDTILDVDRDPAPTERQAARVRGGSAVATFKYPAQESPRPYQQLLSGSKPVPDPWQGVVPLGPQVQISTSLLSSPPPPPPPVWFQPQPHQVHTMQHNNQLLPVPVMLNNPSQMWAPSTPQWFF